jgi:hypothetical protein
MGGDEADCDDDVRPFPIRGFQRWHNALGKRAVPCIVSNRWLQFPEKSDRFEDGDYPDGDYMFVDVMTTGPRASMIPRSTSPRAAAFS